MCKNVIRQESINNVSFYLKTNNMIIEPYSEKYIDKTHLLLSKIGPNAEFRFKNRFTTKNEYNTILIINTDVIGLLFVFRMEKSTEIYISFTEDRLNKFVLKNIEQLIIEEIKISSGKKVNISVNSINIACIDLVSNMSFQLTSSAYILRLQDLSYSSSDNFLLKTSKYSFRQYQDDKIDEYLHLLDQAFKELLVKNNKPLNPFKKHKEHFRKNFTTANNNGDFFTLWKDDTLIGLYLIEDKYIDYLAIHPKYQSHGLGSFLLHHCINTMNRHNPEQEILLTVQKANTEAIRFYKKNGFKKYSHYSEYDYIGE